MGLSYSADAGATMDAWTRKCLDATGFQNVFIDKGQRFLWEPSRIEYRDGSVTGTVMRYVGDDTVQPAGRFKIGANGEVVTGRKWLKDAAKNVTRRFPDGAHPGSGGQR